MRAQSPAPEPASEPVDSGDPRVVELKKRLDALVARQRADLREGRPRGGDRALPGDAIDTPYGDVHVVEQHLDPAHCHGRAPVAAALRASSTTLGQLTFGDDRDPISAAGALFVDTETTGLSQGAGTLPFLIGLAWFDGESLTLRQLLLQRPGDEAPMLQMVRERICKSSCIVTYNGKSFDWPLLRNRFVMNRVPVPELPPHIDLLHSARCVYKGRLERVRLVNVEDRVLGFLRVDDVEGHEIPELYWSYVRGGSPGALEPVIETVSVHASTAGPSRLFLRRPSSSFFPAILVVAKKEERYLIHLSSYPLTRTGIVPLAPRDGRAWTAAW